jgi:hypothetical protein
LITSSAILSYKNSNFTSNSPHIRGGFTGTWVQYSCAFY